MKHSRVLGVFTSAVLAAAGISGTAVSAAGETGILPNTVNAANTAVKVVEQDCVVEQNSVVSYSFSAGVTKAVSSDVGVVTVSVLDSGKIQLKPVKPGYADITVYTPKDIQYIIHITVPGEGVTTAVKTMVTTTLTTTAAVTTTSQAYFSPTTTVASTSVQMTTAAQSTEIIAYTGDADMFAQAVKKSETFAVDRSTFSANPTYDMFGRLDYINEMQDSAGNIYAAVGSKDTVTIIQKDPFHHTILSNPGYTFGAAAIGDDDHIYAIWGKSLDSNGADADNIVVTKFTKAGKYVAMYPLNSAKTNSKTPFDGGNARLAYNNGKLAVMFDTLWKSGHQGAEFFRLDTATGKYDMSSTNICSHSFGLDLITTDKGFASVQKGDCYSRGLMLYESALASVSLVSDYAWHISGVYSEPGEHQNATFTHMGGIAATSGSYAVAGKSERFYTSEGYGNYKTGVYDVFVRMMSRTKDNTGFAGTDRKDEATGKVADTNVIWLTKSDDTNAAGNVKIAALSGDRYCVLWETLKNKKFDHVSYVILDGKGNILQPETVLTNARLSSTTVDPIVQDDVLTWAVADSSAGTLDWYTFDTNSYILRGDVNSDGTVNAADLVTYSNYLLGKENISARQATAADLTADGTANAYDMVLLRRKVVAAAKK